MVLLLVLLAQLSGVHIPQTNAVVDGNGDEVAATGTEAVAHTPRGGHVCYVAAFIQRLGRGSIHEQQSTRSLCHSCAATTNQPLNLERRLTPNHHQL